MMKKKFPKCSGKRIIATLTALVLTLGLCVSALSAGAETDPIKDAIYRLTRRTPKPTETPAPDMPQPDEDWSAQDEPAGQKDAGQPDEAEDAGESADQILGAEVSGRYFRVKLSGSAYLTDITARLAMYCPEYEVVAAYRIDNADSSTKASVFINQTPNLMRGDKIELVGLNGFQINPRVSISKFFPGQTIVLSCSMMDGFAMIIRHAGPARAEQPYNIPAPQTEGSGQEPAEDQPAGTRPGTHGHTVIPAQPIQPAAQPVAPAAEEPEAPAADPAAEEPEAPAAEPGAEEPEAPAADPAAEQPEATATEPAAEEPEAPAAEPAAEAPETPAAEPGAEEPEAPAADPAAEKPEAPAAEPAAEEPEAPAAVPSADQPVTPAAEEPEAPADEPGAEEPEAPAADPAAEEPEAPATDAGAAGEESPAEEPGEEGGEEPVEKSAGNAGETAETPAGESAENEPETSFRSIQAQLADGAVAVLSGELPEGASIRVKQLAVSVVKLIDSTGKKDKAKTNLYAFELNIRNADGERIDPDGLSLTMTVSGGLIAQAVSQGSGLIVSTLPGGRPATELDCTVTRDSVSFPVDWFAAYRIDASSVAGALPEPDPLNVRIESSMNGMILLGDTITLTSFVEDAPAALSYQWECDRGEGYQPVDGAVEDSFTFVATAESVLWNWRLTVVADSVQPAAIANK